jgi:hypothetical protein
MPGSPTNRANFVTGGPTAHSGTHNDRRPYTVAATPVPQRDPFRPSSRFEPDMFIDRAKGSRLGVHESEVFCIRGEDVFDVRVEYMDDSEG